MPARGHRRSPRATRTRLSDVAVRVLSRCVCRAPILCLSCVAGAVACAALAVWGMPEALVLQTELESYRARGTPRTTRAIAAALATLGSESAPMSSSTARQRRRRVLAVDGSVNETSLMPPPVSSNGAVPPMGIPPPSVPPPSPFVGPAPSRRLRSSFDRILLGMSSKAGVDGGTGEDEFHVVVSQAKAVYEGESASVVSLKRALTQACVLNREISNSFQFEDVCERDGSGDCVKTFSIFDVSNVYATMGVLDVYESFVRLGAASGYDEVAARMNFIRARCAYAPITRQSMYEAHSALCDEVDACHSVPCEDESPRCMIGEFKIDICDFMSNVEPSVEEVLRVASVPTSLEGDSRSCDIGIDSVLHTVSGASVLITWASRWDVIEAMAAPFGMLISNGMLPGTESGYQRIRLVFRLKHNGAVGTTWVKNIGASIIKDFNDDISARMLGVSATWRHHKAYDSLLSDQLETDMMFAIGSLAATLALILLITRSIVLAIVGGSLCIVGTTVLTHAIYFGVYARQWFGIIHVSGVFLSIGLAADDIFVINSHWHMSQKYVEQTENMTTRQCIESRMDWTLKHSILSIGVTSCTTAAAFASNIPSKIPPVRLFGVYMATQVIVLLVVTSVVIPSLLVLLERWKHLSVSRSQIAPAEIPRTVSSCYSRSHVGRRATVDLGEFLVLERVIHRRVFSVPSECLELDHHLDTLPLIQGASTRAEPPRPPFASFYARANAGFFWMMRWKRTLVAIAACFFAASIYVALRITSDSGNAPLSLWPSNSPIHAYTAASRDFNITQYEESVIIQFTFGVDDERSAKSAIADKTLKYQGAPVWLDQPTEADFWFSRVASQRWLLNFCDRLKSEEMKPNVLSRNAVNCWISDVDEWLKHGGLDNAHPTGLPLPRDEFQEVVTQFATNANSYGLLRFLKSKEDCEKYRDGDPLCVAFSGISFVARTQRTDLRALRQSHSYWYQFFSLRLDDGPIETRSSFMSSDGWVLADTVTELRQAALFTVAYSLVLAFVVLFACTRDFVVSMLATICIASVTCDFIAFMILRNVPLGLIESVCVCLIVGLSIDYIAHVAVAYVATRNESLSKEERVQAAMHTVGGAVAAGWLSSVIASLFLLGATVVFFTTFASFIAFTLTMSFVHALFVLPALLACFC